MIQRLEENQSGVSDRPISPRSYATVSYHARRGSSPRKSSMATLTVSTLIAADPSTVFDAFTDFASSLRHIPAISNVEMLTNGSARVGTRFKQTRITFGHEMVEKTEVVALVPGRSYELLRESLGLEYHEAFRFRPEGGSTRVELHFTEKPLTRTSKLLKPVRWLMKGMVRKSLEADLDWMRRWIERGRAPTNGSLGSSVRKRR